ncbi:MAG: Ig-like domain-containing protein [Spirochaetia bacterium]
MKKSFLRIFALIFVIVFASCSNSFIEEDPSEEAMGRDYDSSINSTIPVAIEEEASVGPEAVVTGDSAAFQTVTSDFSSNIQNGAVDVPVNEPVSITFTISIDSASVNNQTLYLTDENNQRLYSRATVSGNTITLIPQIRLQPRSTYNVTAAGIKDVYGRTIETVSINYTNTDLDYGLYWYGYYGRCEKYIPGVENAFYNPSAQSVIYAHGWQAGAVAQTDGYGREGYGYEIFHWAEDNFDGSEQYNGLRKWTNTAWLDDGWNTGMVYWNQFADEPTTSGGNLTGVHAAEAKIWSFHGPNGSRYAYLNDNNDIAYRYWDRHVNFNGQDVVVESAGELLGLYVTHALQYNTSGNIRFVGHSLGNQMATVLAWECYQQGIGIDRISLLDPAWSAYSKSYLPNDGYGTWTGERARNYLMEMDAAVEIYHTTGMNLGAPVMDDNVPLTEWACDVNQSPWYYDADNLSGKHIAPRHTYFWSYESAPPVECTIGWWNRRNPTGEDGPSASASTARIREMMGTEYEWTQVEGRYTSDPSDDWFERKEKESGWLGSLW